mmetsp:Transcript_10968/g.30080  ORF Transcript_10968/g.30080 Transcript_10968/m.30080 type:complete len:145 (-) Transcript_10968:32-466(-)
MASNPFEGFSFSQNAATAGAATAGVKPRAKSPSHSGTPHKGHRASSPTADSSESIPVVSPQKRRRGNPEPSLCSRSAKGKGDQGLAQCLARENQLKQRLGGGLGEKLGGYLGSLTCLCAQKQPHVAITQTNRQAGTLPKSAGCK